MPATKHRAKPAIELDMGDAPEVVVADAEAAAEPEAVAEAAMPWVDDVSTKTCGA